MNQRRSAKLAPVATKLRNPKMAKILNCAEREFAARGYSATPLHRIAAAAKVNQALINYYFGSKQQLYQAVFHRRGVALSQKRLDLLEALEKSTNAQLAVEDLVSSFLRPAISMLYGESSAKDFLRLQARLQNEPKEIAARLRASVYDTTTRAYIERFKLALPHINSNAIVWRMTMMIGAYLYVVADPYRLEQLSDGACNVSDQEEVLRQLSTFLAGGFRSPI
ncbi:MAG: TetR/AcrR family transcriptional regulator [Terriglobales bacterium]